MKKYITAFFIIGFFFLFVQSSYAKPSFGIRFGTTVAPTFSVEGENGGLTTTPGEIGNQFRQKVIKEVQEKNLNLIDRVKNLIKKNLKFNARIQGEIMARTDTSLSVKKDDGTTYTVNLTTNTKLVRRFGGKSTIDEFSLGNKVLVFGKFTDDAKTTIEAKLVRNLSVQKRWGAFFGEVSEKTTDGFKLKSIQRGDQTVTIGSGTKLVNRKEETIVPGDILVGHRVRVKGVWDRSTNTISEVDQVKDFSIPLRPKPTVTVTQPVGPTTTTAPTP